MKSYLFIGLLSACSFAFAQNAPQDDATPPPPPPGAQQQQAANPEGGWKRVGEAPNQAPGDPSDPQMDSNQAPPPGYQAAPPANYRQQPYQQQPYSQQPYQGQQAYPPPAPVPPQVTIPAGTFITVRINQPLSSDKNQPGDSFSASLIDPIVANGVVVAEPGQTLAGRVAVAQHHGSGKAGKLGVQLTTLTLVDGQQIPLNTELTSRRGATTPGGAEAGTIVASTGVGAAIGAAAGWGTGAAIGAGAGALAGIIGVVVTHNHASVIYPEQVLTFRLQAPVTISTQNASQAFHYVEPGEYSQPYYGPGQNQSYAGAPASAPAPYYYGYPYPYYSYGYPWYWGPSVSFYWGPGYWGGRGWYGGHYYYGRGFATRGAVGFHGGRR